MVFNAGAPSEAIVVELAWLWARMDHKTMLTYFLVSKRNRGNLGLDLAPKNR